MKVKQGDRFKCLRAYAPYFVIGDIVKISSLKGNTGFFQTKAHGFFRWDADCMRTWFEPYNPKPKGHPLTKIFS